MAYGRLRVTDGELYSLNYALEIAILNHVKEQPNDKEIVAELNRLKTRVGVEYYSVTGQTIRQADGVDA